MAREILKWAFAAVSCAGLLHSSVSAQAGAGRPYVAAATVTFLCSVDSKPCLALAGGNILDPIRFTCGYCTFTGLVYGAFGLHRVDQILGAPLPLQYARYRLDMTVSSPVDKATMMHLMWGVAARAFHVRWHLENRSLPALALIVGKQGPKLKSLDPTAPVERPRFDFSAQVMHSQSIAELVAQINNFLGPQPHRLVIDSTGLTGRYDIELHLRPAGAGPAWDTSRGQFFALISEQLGLDVVPTKQKAHVTYVVIDGAQQIRSKWVMP